MAGSPEDDALQTVYEQAREIMGVKRLPFQVQEQLRIWGQARLAQGADPSEVVSMLLGTSTVAASSAPPAQKGRGAKKSKPEKPPAKKKVASAKDDKATTPDLAVLRGSVKALQTYLDDTPGAPVQALLDAEKKGKNRKTAVAALEQALAERS